MQGSIEVDVLSFLEKFFLYGSLIWLLMEGRFRRSVATTLVAATLLVTSIAEMYLPGRSAEITDSLMAIAIAVVFAFVTRGDDTARASPELYQVVPR
jgi:VanZ family protein